MISWFLNWFGKSLESKQHEHEYVRGEFVVKDPVQTQRLLQHDAQDREVYDGIEQQISRLKVITQKIDKVKKRCKHPGGDIEAEVEHG